MKRCAEITAPGVKLIAEVIVAPAEIGKYFGEEGNLECDIAYHATLMALIWNSLATTKVGLLFKAVNKIPSKPYGTTWINYVRGHDDIGLGFDDEDIYQVGFDARMHRAFLFDFYTGRFHGSLARGALFMHNPRSGDARISGTLASLAGLEKALELDNPAQVDQSIKKILLAHALIMSFGGLPMIFSGDELGLSNEYSYQEDPSKKEDNRWMHRPPMDWVVAKKRKIPETIEHGIFSGIQKIIKIRKNSPEWADRNNCRLVDCHNQHVLGYLRYPTTESMGIPTSKTLVLMNFHPSTQLVDQVVLFRQGFDTGYDVIDKYTNQPPRAINGFLELKPYQFYFLTENLR